MKLGEWSLAMALVLGMFFYLAVLCGTVSECADKRCPAGTHARSVPGYFLPACVCSP